MWQGVLGLKNDQCVVQMHFISGNQPLVKMSLPQQAADGTVQPLRIAQRMRLEQTQLEGVAKRMQVYRMFDIYLYLVEIRCFTLFKLITLVKLEILSIVNTTSMYVYKCCYFYYS